MCFEMQNYLFVIVLHLKNMPPVRERTFECIVTYEVAIAIQKRSPGVARVDGCVCLDHILRSHAHQVFHISKQPYSKI